MKFLDLNGLKHLLGKLVKYDEGGSNVSSINNLEVNKIKPTYIQPKAVSGNAPVFMIFPDTNTMSFKAGKMQIEFSSNEEIGFHLVSYPLLESIFPEEGNRLKYEDLFFTIANILHTLKKKGIME